MSDQHATHFLGGLFLFMFSLVFIILFGIFSSNCNNTVCTIPDTTMLQITNIRYAIWIPICALLFIGFLLIAGARNEKYMIKNKAVAGIWCNIFPIISLTLLVSSSLLYSIINADGFNCGDVKPEKSSKIIYSDLHVSLFHMATGMITMSAVLFCISVYTLYDFWKETDEQKIQKAKDALAQFEKIAKLSPGGSAKPGMATDLAKLKTALDEGAKLDKENDLEYYNKITEIDDFLEKSKGLEEARNKALQDIEASKMSKGSEQQAKSLATVKSKQLLNEFDNITDESKKIDEICKYAVSEKQEDKLVYDALKQTEFYKQNSKKIQATCGKTLDEYNESLAQEQRVQYYYGQFEIAFKKKDSVDILGVLESICNLGIKDSYRTQIFSKIIEHYGESIRNLGLDSARLCATGGPSPGGKKQVTLLIEQLRARTDKPSPPSSPSPPPVQVPFAQESSGQSSPPLKNVDKIDTGLQPSFTKEDTKCVNFSRGVKISTDPTKFICNTLDDKDNTGMSNEYILECLRKNKLTKENSLGGLRSNCLFSDEISDAPAEIKKIGKPPMDLWGEDNSSTADLGIDPFGNPVKRLVKLPGNLFRAKKQGKKIKR